MKINRLDHFVLTTQDLEACLAFYGEGLDMEVRESNGRYALMYGSSKINIHTKPAEFLPAAKYPTYGALDLCFIVDEPMEDIVAELAKKGIEIELGPVERHGAQGTMDSIYLRDPDGNLVELSHYRNI